MKLNKLFISGLIVCLFLTACDSNESSADKDIARSFEIGATEGFCELVSYGVKQLGLGVPMKPEKMDEYMPYIEKVAEKHGVKIYRETNLIDTDLFTTGIADGYDVPLIYTGSTLTQYLRLKEDRKRLEDDGLYHGKAREEIARRFGRLLSYTPRTVNNQLTLHTDFRTMYNFGVKATNLNFYYNDLDKALDFYKDILGLEQVSQEENSVCLRLASDSYLTLINAATAPEYSGKPKTVALALVTDMPDKWYSYLQEKQVKIKYKYKEKEGSAHDGFVAVDPEGYLLEFERFNQHPENEKFAAILEDNSTILQNVEFKEELSIRSSVTWLYYNNILGMQNYYQDVLGFELVCDQGWAKIYRSSESGFIGLVDELRGMHRHTEEKAVNISFELEDLKGWYNYSGLQKYFEINGKAPELLRNDNNSFFRGTDPEGYHIRFFN